MGEQRQAAILPRLCRAGSRLLCLLSICVVGGDAIYAVSDPTAEAPEYCTLYNHQVRNGTTEGVIFVGAPER